MVNRWQLEFMKTWSDDKLKSALENFKRESMFTPPRWFENTLNFALAIEKELKRRGKFD